jgi:hypothetical protein
MTKLSFYIFIILLSFLLFGCDIAPRPVSDSDQSYIATAKIPVDDNVYNLSGTIVSDVNSYSYQVGQSYVSGYGTQYGGFVSGSGSLWAEGKGFVRIKLESISPSNDLAQAGDTIVVKTTDQKIRALLPGDYVKLKCRAQYENLAAVRNNSTFDETLLETWEFDYCRMSSVKISK